jgi:hypothetical protein
MRKRCCGWGHLKPEYRGPFFPRETVPILASTYYVQDD